MPLHCDSGIPWFLVHRYHQWLSRRPKPLPCVAPCWPRCRGNRAHDLLCGAFWLSKRTWNLYSMSSECVFQTFIFSMTVDRIRPLFEGIFWYRIFCNTQVHFLLLSHSICRQSHQFSVFSFLLLVSFWMKWSHHNRNPSVARFCQRSPPDSRRTMHPGSGWWSSFYCSYRNTIIQRRRLASRMRARMALVACRQCFFHQPLRLWLRGFVQMTEARPELELGWATFFFAISRNAASMNVCEWQVTDGATAVVRRVLSLERW